MNNEVNEDNVNVFPTVISPKIEIKFQDFFSASKNLREALTDFPQETYKRSVHLFRRKEISQTLQLFSWNIRNRIQWVIHKTYDKEC